jgi:hypothetical protein
MELSLTRASALENPQYPQRGRELPPNVRRSGRSHQ